MPFTLELSNTSLTIAATDLGRGAVRQESNHVLFFALSHGNTPADRPVVSVPADKFNIDDGSGPVTLSWDIDDLRDRTKVAGGTAPVMLLITLVADTVTVTHNRTQSVVATAAIPVLKLCAASKASPCEIEFRDRATEMVLQWGLQEGASPSGAAREHAVKKGILRVEECHFKGVAKLSAPDDDNWQSVRLTTKTYVDEFLGNLTRTFPNVPTSTPSARKYNLPIYAHHYPPSGEASVPLPSFVCFNKPPVYKEYTSGVDFALLRLLRIALHDQSMTEERFVEVVDRQMHHQGGEMPEPDFFRAVHACIAALTLPALCRPYHFDGSCIKTSAVRPQWSAMKAGGASARPPSEDIRSKLAPDGALNEADVAPERFDSSVHVLGDQLAVWGQENTLGLDCEDGDLMALQLFKMVRAEFSGQSERGPWLGSCWASVLRLFEPISTRNCCLRQNSEEISHILLLLVDKVNFAEGMVRGCLRLTRKGVVKSGSEDERHINEMIGRLQETITHAQPWQRHLGYFAAETTNWQSPELTTFDRAHGAPDPERTKRLRQVAQFMSAKYANNTPFLRDYTSPKTHYLDVYEADPNDSAAFVDMCLKVPAGQRLYPFYHVITNGDLSIDSVCQPKRGTGGVFCPTVVFNSLWDEGEMQCGTFLQRLALAPDRALLVPALPFIPERQLDEWCDCAYNKQWPSLFFISESTRMPRVPAVQPRGPSAQPYVDTPDDLILGTRKRKQALESLAFAGGDRRPPVAHYDRSKVASEPLCVKLLVRPGTAVSTAFGNGLVGFLRDTPVPRFTLLDFDYVRYNVAETYGAKDTNFFYVLRVFVHPSP